MASPVDTFKSNFFGQLKSYGDAVQGAFEQRIARPLLALKRDLGRSSSATRTPSDQESVLSSAQQISFRTRQDSTLSSPLEIIDIEPTGSFKTILDKVKNTLTSSTKRRTSDCSIDDTIKPSREHRHSSISSLSNRTHRKPRLRHLKSVSFAENTEYDNNLRSRNDEKEMICNALADRILMTSIDETTLAHTNPSSTDDEDHNDNNDFEHDFYQVIRPRRISIANSNDLVYQDLSAEIVAYVLKNALRILEKEDEDLLVAENSNLFNHNEQDEDFIDLK